LLKAEKFRTFDVNALIGM